MYFDKDWVLFITLLVLLGGLIFYYCNDKKNTLPKVKGILRKSNKGISKSKKKICKRVRFYV